MHPITHSRNPWPPSATPTNRVTRLSGDGLYRLTLWREWSMEVNRYAVIVGLNPSTADAVLNDRTINRCIAFSKAWGMDALCMLNLFALRTKDPEVMKVHPDPVGPGNDTTLIDLAKGASVVVAAWGTHGVHQARDVAVSMLLKQAGIRMHCLGVTKAGHPKHPLYLSKSTALQPFAL